MIGGVVKDIHQFQSIRQKNLLIIVAHMSYNVISLYLGIPIIDLGTTENHRVIR